MSSFADISLEDRKPPEGWIVELAEAKTAAKTDEQDAVKQFRVATAYKTLRQWENCKAASEEALRMKTTRALKTALRRLVATAEKELNVKSLFLREPEKASEIIEMIRNAGNARDTVAYTHNDLKNSNVLHFAATSFDIRLLEAFIAEGMAIDFPFLNWRSRDVPVIVPTDATALLIVCARLAWFVIERPNRRKEDGYVEAYAGEYDDVNASYEECAVCLIGHGADCEVKLNLALSSSEGRKNSIMQDFRKLGFDGKSARQLAAIAGSHRVLGAMDEFQGVDAKLAKVFCRCGSRLPWRECHSGGVQEVSPYIGRDQEPPLLLWRLSPTSKCPCKSSEKDYFNCCWVETARPVYLNPSTADQCSIAFKGDTLLKGIDGEHSRFGHFFAYGLRDDGFFDSTGYFPEASNRSERRTCIVNELLSLAADNPNILADCDGACSLLVDWDVEVYAGCVARLDHWFLWKSAHWDVDKPDLLQRVKDWDEALATYCDDMGLVNAEREQVIQQHSASPFAPCGHAGCAQIEKSAKDFQRCSDCRAVGYCSRKCQKRDWKQHKTRCSKSVVGLGT